MKRSQENSGTEGKSNRDEKDTQKKQTWEPKSREEMQSDYQSSSSDPEGDDNDKLVANFSIYEVMKGPSKVHIRSIEKQPRLPEPKPFACEDARQLDPTCKLSTYGANLDGAEKNKATKKPKVKIFENAQI